MIPEEFIEKVKQYLNTLSVGDLIGGWEYKGPSRINFSSFNEKWDKEKYHGYQLLKEARDILLPRLMAGTINPSEIEGGV